MGERGKRIVEAARDVAGWSGRFWWLLPPLVVGLTYAGSARFEFVADARFLILENRYMDGVGQLWANLTHDYFWSSSGNFIAYWRPLTKASWLFEAQSFGTWAGGFHLVQVAWQLAGVAGVVALARRLGSAPLWASFAGLVYGLHPAVAEPTCLIMARSDVVAATGSVWSVVAWLAFRETKRAAWGVAHAVLLLVAFGSKEASIFLLPLLVAWAATDRGWGARRWQPLSLAPVGVVAAAYLVGRQLVLGDAARPRVGLDPLRVLVGGGRYLFALLPLSPTTGVHNVSLAEAWSRGSLLAAAALWLVALGVLAWAAQKHDVAACGLLFWIGAALAPVLLVEQLAVPNVAGKLPLADRWLLPSLPAFSVLVALMLERARRPLLRTTIVGACGVWVVAAFLIAPTAHARYRDEGALLALEEEQYVETPEEFRTAEDRCRHEERGVVAALQQRAFEEAYRRSKALPAECLSRDETRFNLLSALVETGRMTEARPVVEGLLARPPHDSRNLAPLSVLAGRTLLSTGDPARAERLLLEARRRGDRGCNVTLLLARAAEALAFAEPTAKRFEETALRFDQTAQCLKRAGAASDPSLYLMAGYWWTRASRPADARAMLTLARQGNLDRQQSALADDLAGRIARGESGQ
jgi:hypothetical protein